MNAPNDGGPAFPVTYSHADDEGMRTEQRRPGMSLRDWFAGQALAGLLAHHGADDLRVRGAAAKVAFNRADDMLAARATVPDAIAQAQLESDLILFARACTGGHVMVDTNDDTLHVKSGPRTGPWTWPLAGLIEDGVPVFTDELRAALRSVLAEAQVREDEAPAPRRGPKLDDTEVAIREAAGSFVSATKAGACSKCGGCGKVSDTPDEDPWSVLEALPPGSDIAVRLGVVKPKPCPVCAGQTAGGGA